MLLTPDLYRQMATVSLHDAHIDELTAFGTVHETRAGEVLYDAGDTEYSLVVVLAVAGVHRAQPDSLSLAHTNGSHLHRRFRPIRRRGRWARVGRRPGNQAPERSNPLQVASAVGLDMPACNTGRVADLIVVGAGPAGLSAAVYGASEGLSTIVVDKVGIGGQAGASSRIEYYLGFPAGISGADLAFKAELQAVKFGARVAMPRRATSLSCEDGLIRFELDDGSELRGRSAIIATGARYRDLGVPGQQAFQGVGVYHAATELESQRCRGGAVVVVGAGNSAGQAAMFLSRTAQTVHLVCRGRASGAACPSTWCRVSNAPRTCGFTRNARCARSRAGIGWKQRRSSIGEGSCASSA